jgi:hypothetical protein
MDITLCGPLNAAVCPASCEYYKVIQRPLQMKIWKKRNKSRRFVATLPSLRIGLRHKHSFHSPFFLWFHSSLCLSACYRKKSTQSKDDVFRLDVVFYTAVLSWFLEKSQTRTAVRPRSSTIVVLDSERKVIVSLDANIKINLYFKEFPTISINVWEKE